MTGESMIHDTGIRRDVARLPGSKAEAPNALDFAWRNEVVAALGLRKDVFQFALGGAHLRVEDASGLYQYSDFVPPKASVARISSRVRNRRSAAYHQMLKALLPQTEQGLRGVLGAHYSDWIACRNDDPGGVDHSELFSAWAQARLPRQLRDVAATVYDLGEADPGRRALEAVADPRNRLPFVGRDGSISDMPTYSITNDHAVAATRQETQRSISFDSKKCSGRNAEFDLFGNVSELAELGRRASRGRITVTGDADAWGSAPTHPGAWCDEFELDRAWIAGDDPEVWDKAALGNTWETFFGENGYLARRVARVVTVRGLDLTVTSHVTYSAEEVAQVAAHARRGVWPLLAADGPPVHRQTVRHNENGTLSVHLTLPTDRLQIWGGYIAGAPD